MPQFSYRAIDAAGQQVDGVQEAASENELILRLSSLGLRIQAMSRSSNPLGQGVRPIVQQQPQQQARPAAPSVRPTISAPNARQVVQLAPSTVQLAHVSHPMVRTKRATRMDLHFTFANIANLARAGFGAANVFSELAGRATKQYLRDVFQSLSSTSTEGMSLADAMSRYPDVFPEGTVGAVRAGETGGYLPEACERLALQFREDHRVAWKARIMRWIIISGVVAVPITMALTAGLDKVFDYYGSTANVEPSVAERIKLLSDKFWESMVGIPGVILIVFCVGYICLALWMKRTENRPLRHRLTLKIPLLKRYATNECLSALGWHLSRLSSAGIAPARAWTLATLAVPNMEFATRAAAASLNTTESTKMSELARRSGLFPPDHESLFFTGEVAGNLPQALDQSSGLANEELQHNRVFVNYAFAGVALALSAILTIIAASTFYVGYYESLFKQVDKVDQEL